MLLYFQTEEERYKTAQQRERKGGKERRGLGREGVGREGEAGVHNQERLT